MVSRLAMIFSLFSATRSILVFDHCHRTVSSRELRLPQAHVCCQVPCCYLASPLPIARGPVGSLFPTFPLRRTHLPLTLQHHLLGNLSFAANEVDGLGVAHGGVPLMLYFSTLRVRILQ